MDAELLAIAIAGACVVAGVTIGLYIRSRQWMPIDDETPAVGQRVWYYFRIVGVWRGHYRGLGEYGHEFECDENFGFLSGDVTHWKPYRNEKKRPKPPAEDNYD